MIRKQEQRRACPVRCGKLGAASALAWKEEGRVAISTAVEFAMRWRVARQACTRPQIQAPRVAASFATAGKDQPHPRSLSAFQLLWAPVLPSLAQSASSGQSPYWPGENAILLRERLWARRKLSTPPLQRECIGQTEGTNS